ncbi:MAG TPA: TetR/AcrR family transcriptional regulator [Candidatus Binatia bacterium]|nr:TetR/AcrR family transcriptional regulator [Candidatus Binatia bacterium]
MNEQARKRVPRDVRETAILEAALKAFSEDGYAGASLKRIATDAGLASPQLLAWYFPSKRDLYLRTMLRYAAVFADLHVGLEEWEHDPAQYLHRIAERFLAGFSDPSVRMAYRLILRSPQANSNRHLTEYRPENIYSVLENYLDRQVKAGAIQCGDCAMAASAFVALLWGQATSRLFPMLTPPPHSDEEWARYSVQIFLYGLKPR